jgi:hypothetical protein
MIDHELRQALAVDPSPDFVARVRERIGREGRASQAWWWRPALVAVFAAVAIAFAVNRMALRRLGPTAPPPRLAELESKPLPSLDATLPSTASKRLARVDRRSVDAPTPTAPESASFAEPVVLISLSEARAIRKLIDDVRQGRIDLSSLPPSPSELEDVRFAPIILPPVGPGEGVRQ